MRTTRLRTATVRRTTAIFGAGLLAVATAACSTGTPVAKVTPTHLGAAAGASSGTPAETAFPEETRPARSTSAPATPTSRRPSSPSSSPTPTPTSSPTTKPPVVAKPKPKPKPVVVVLRPGDNGSKVRALQARLKQIQWFEGDVTNQYGPHTTAAVRGFQAKRGYDASGVLDETTWIRLLGMTRTPTKDELANVKPKPPEAKTKPKPKPKPKAKPGTTKPAGFAWDVDERCLTGRVMCISKGDNSLTWVIDGVPQYRFDVRFGSDELPTREGTFSVLWKKKDVISNLYHTPMPYSMFFSGGQAVHYSSNFARLGYNGASHGCVNVRDWNGVVRLYNESRVGDKVVVHW